jgi:hypothetical protein
MLVNGDVLYRSPAQSDLEVGPSCIEAALDFARSYHTSTSYPRTRESSALHVLARMGFQFWDSSKARPDVNNNELLRNFFHPSPHLDAAQVRFFNARNDSVFAKTLTAMVLRAATQLAQQYCLMR